MSSGGENNEVEEGLTHLHLERFLRGTACNPDRFRVVGADELEITEPLEPGQVRICNTGTRESGGEHWVCFYVQGDGCKGNIINYFDPLGECSTEPLNFKKFISNYNMLVSNKGLPVQHNGKGPLFSNTCGLHCSFVCHLFCDNPNKFRSLSDVMKVYDVSNTESAVNNNECMVLYYMCDRYDANQCKTFKKLKGCYTEVVEAKKTKKKKK
jgi:Adenovirus endoprotease